MGKAAFFIRLYGCPLHCRWCDSAGTWHKDYIPEHIERWESKTLATAAFESGARICVVTGGEPCIHDLQPLTNALHAIGFRCHLETSGAFEITGEWDWVTVSPKDFTVEAKPMKLTSANRANELKIIVDDPNVPFQWLAKFEASMVLRTCNPVYHGNVWLHPEWSQRENPLILSAISRAVKERPDIFRAGYQVHKLYRVDLEDARSRLAVPLGGDVTKGF